jgi:tRNA nucleotidyltransferase (CCA-adding enzyme)
MKTQYPEFMRSNLAARLADFFAEDTRGASAVYVFGSVARGTSRDDSDVDIGVLFAVAPEPTFDAQPFGLEGGISAGPFKLSCSIGHPWISGLACSVTDVSCSIATGRRE